MLSSGGELSVRVNRCRRGSGGRDAVSTSEPPPLVPCLVNWRTVFKNLCHGRGRRSRFLLGYDVSFRLFQKQMIEVQPRSTRRLLLCCEGGCPSVPLMSNRPIYA